MSLQLDMVQRFNGEPKKKFLEFTREAGEMIMQLFVAGQYPRIEEVVERTMILAPEGNIDAISLLEEIRESRNSNHREIPLNDDDPRGDFPLSLRELEQDCIRNVHGATVNNKTQAAKIFGCPSNVPASPFEKCDRLVFMRTNGESGSINHDGHEETRSNDRGFFFVNPQALMVRRFVASDSQGIHRQPR